MIYFSLGQGTWLNPFMYLTYLSGADVQDKEHEKAQSQTPEIERRAVSLGDTTPISSQGRCIWGSVLRDRSWGLKGDTHGGLGVMRTWRKAFTLSLKGPQGFSDIDEWGRGLSSRGGAVWATKFMRSFSKRTQLFRKLLSPDRELFHDP